MPDSHSVENDFLSKITELIEENMSNEKFGVSELAREVGMSRSNLLRKVKKLAQLSVSQFIRQVRLQNAMEILRQTSSTVSEVSYEVGFGSTSYFIKCFGDYYGFPPGEVGKRDLSESDAIQVGQSGEKPMTGQTRMTRFWRELKRRKVVKVIIIYASISFILLQLVSILIEPLYLPQWMMTLVIVLLAIGFPIAILFSWIFDITPTGLEVTGSVNEKGIQQQAGANRKRNILYNILIGVLLVVVVILAYPKIFGNGDRGNLNPELEKSIAVLPFKNDSNDSTNVYIINGLMESILTNLQKIEDLRVISRTSVEKFRNDPKTIPEISKELNVNYFVEGSGQKIGNQILLNIQLIDASSDKHLWAEQYNREATEIFKLQMEVAKNIADEIQAIITPEEEERISKAPTDDLVAYDNFLKGLDLLNKPSPENLENSISYFEKAIARDPEFARAHAAIAIAYYYMDERQAEKKYSTQIGHYADQALVFDSQLPQSLIAKALFYMNTGEYVLAVPYLEKALEYNPNYGLVFIFLVDLYVNYLPNTEKYLEYALKGMRLNIPAVDSITKSFGYLHLSNAFLQSGFLKESEVYINKSLEYYPDNLYAEYVKAYILFAEHRDLGQTKELLIKTLDKDPTRLDIIQEVGKICYLMRDYKSAYAYYKKFMDSREAQNLDLYRGENAKIGLVLSKMGLTEESEKIFEDYREYAENDKSIYKHLSLAVYYSFKDDTKKAIEELKLFSQQDNYHYWILLLETDPLLDNIKELPEFKKILGDIETKFWNSHRRIRASLEEKDLL